MIPVLTPEEMKAVDQAAPEPVEVLVRRAGAAVARAALELMGGGYGRRVVVVAGKGNNGADGRDAAARLCRRGVRAVVVEAADAPPQLPPCDLVIDAAYGTGFRGDYDAPDPGPAPVLAVDIPSGVDGLTGQAGEHAVSALRTVTFAALKPGLLLHPGAERAGQVSVADIGLDTSSATTGLVEASDLRRWLPPPLPESHKWKTAVWVVAGSPGMLGAAHLCARGAMRAGAGTVRLGVPGLEVPDPPLEVVGRPLPQEGWEQNVLPDLDRMKAVAVGPGMGRTDAIGESARRLVAEAQVPTVVDADALYALGPADEAARILARRRAPAVLTPHDGEFSRLTGSRPPADRLGATRELAARLGATVLLKGATTVVAGPDGQALLAAAGDARLATAGSGDVLAGVIAAFLAQGLQPVQAAAAAAYAHGAASHLGWRRGLVAGDLLDLLPALLTRDA